MRLEGKVAIVTGGAKGIGRAITTAYVGQGARVLVVDVDEAAGATLAADLGEAVTFLAADLSVEANASRIVEAAVAAYGRLDVLVNNAHASRQAPLLETTPEMWELSLGTGFWPVFWLMREAHPHLKESRGTIINFASGAGLRGNPTQGAYAAAKEAVRGISRVAANEWARDGINVNLISPLARTEGVDAFIAAHPEQEEALNNTNPMRRLGDPYDDIAPVAVFLASGDADYMTGQTLMVDGGAIMLR
ncbi:SDR family oxidoreductase [Nocardioides sp. AE5]|uniref:SDR family NAD(P)-dependent oxidoreductase n=1 Tax=Nocardioides sp. AE5 TaxID=2962573 RepID=UPI002882A123|nr:SDR family oxidoreductase [Nocardioides sp. AE5]MDT0202766.1 SDR family oxidoreductase [Nocardioides sp. AE5]